MASNRRSRTDCDTSTPIPRDPSNSAPVAQPPILPLIESADPHALFSWARNLNLSLEDWFQMVNSVITDDTVPTPDDIYGCYCFVMCEESRAQSCSAIEDFFSFQTNLRGVDFFSRNWVEDLVGESPSPTGGGRFKAGTYYPGYDPVFDPLKPDGYGVPRISTTGEDLTPFLITDAYPIDVCPEVPNNFVLSFQGTSGTSSFLNAGVYTKNMIKGRGDNAVMGGMFHTNGPDGRRTIFSYTTNNASNAPDQPQGTNWDVNWSTSGGFVQYQKGNENDGDALVQVKVAHPDLFSSVPEFKHIRVHVTRTDNSVGLSVWCDGVYCGQASTNTTVSGDVDLVDWDGHQTDQVSDSEYERFFSFGYGGAGARNGWAGIILWTYWGGSALLPDLSAIDEVYEENFRDFVDEEGFNPQVGDIIVVKEVKEDGTVVWCNEPRFANGEDGDVLYQGPGGPEDVYFAPPPLGLPLGGIDGQVLRKEGGEDGDAVWSNETRYVMTYQGAVDPAQDEVVVPGDFWLEG